MSPGRIVSWALLAAIAAAALLPGLITSAPYGVQFREHINEPPSRQFPLGTDDLGRDRLSRLLHGARISLLLAPAAALLSTLLAGLVGGAGGYLARGAAVSVGVAIDLFLSLPWLFLLLTVRAMLPLNTTPVVSVAITFGLLGVLGWAAPARVVQAGTRSLARSEFALQARAAGSTGGRLLVRHLLPNLKPILVAQFWTAVPVYILSEANLGLLGLGVSEPLPSLGNLLRELETYPAAPERVWVLAPALLLVTILACLHGVLPRAEGVQS
jgi:ABC-type dipeptide/oligopeptide/nickel transport system permease subunit